MPSNETYQTMGYSTPDRIVVRGLDLCEEVLGEVNFGDMVFLEVVGRLPAAGESRLCNAVLVCLTEHGMTPSAIAARLTVLGAPSAVQGAIAAGVLGAGEVFLGAVEGAALLLRQIAVEAHDTAVEERDVVRERVRRMLADGQRIPGIGHPVHKPDDPRTTRLFALAEEEGTAGAAQRLALLLREEAEAATGRVLPINADGACGAVLADLGFTASVGRGFAAVARAAGVLGHVLEQQRQPSALEIWDAAESTIPYRDPTPLF